jgi:predicted PurR-regulated permease PerM
MATNPNPATENPSRPPAPVEIRGESRRLDRIQTFSGVVIAVVLVLAGCYFAKLPLVVLLVSVLLAFILAPIVDLFQKARLPRALAALLAVLLFLAASYGVVYVSYSRAQQFAHELPRYSGEIRKVLGRVHRTSASIQKTAAGVLSPEAKPQTGVQSSGSWNDMFSSLGSITEVIFATSFIPFLVYFMLTWQSHVRSASVMLFRNEHRQTAYVALGLITAMIRSFLVGNLLVGLFISAVSTAVFGFLGLPYFYFIGVISGFLSLIPYLGVLLAIVPPVLAGVGHIHSTQFAVIVATVFGLHLFALNVLYPKFLGNRLQLNPLAVTVALLFWGWLWGAMGLILAIPLTAAMKIILDHVEHLKPYGAWLGE